MNSHRSCRRLPLAGSAILLLATSCAVAPVESEGGPVGSEPTGTASSALFLNPTNLEGNLSIVSPPEGSWVSMGNGAVYRTIDGLSSVAYAEAGDSLDIGVSAEIQTAGSVWLRAVIDGVVASPSDVFFKGSAGASWDGVRSFHFVKSNLAAGPHVIEIQWIGHANTQFRDRSLVVHTASPSSLDGALAVVAAPSGPSIQTSSTVWQDIPGLQTSITCGPSELQIDFSAEMIATSGPLYVRPVVDGLPWGAVRVTEAGTAGNWASRSFTLRTFLSTSGLHDVKLQWVTTAGGNAYLGDRTLAVFSGRDNRPGGAAGALWHDTTSIYAPTTTWADIPSMSRSFTTQDSSSTVAVKASLEAKSSPGKLNLRVLVDGQVANPSEVTLVQGASTFAAYEYAFQVKNVPAGVHDVRFQAKADSGTVAGIQDRTASVIAKRRNGADFAQPHWGQIGVEGRPRHKAYKAIVICMDPLRQDPGKGGAIQRKLTFEELRTWFLGWDAGPNLHNWWTEISRGQVFAGGHTFVDCFDAPAAHQNNYYWNTKGGFVTMHKDAISGADAQVDFHSFDLNGDGVLSYDEAIVFVVKPQFGTAGQTGNSVTLPVDGGQTMTIQYVDIYMNPDNRPASVGVAAHESAHTFGIWDDYLTGSTEPLTPRSVMSEPGWANHLDPEQKLSSGFLMPDVIETSAWSTQWVAVPAVESTGGALLIYDRARPIEYFIVENRWVDVGNYDGLFSEGTQGLKREDQDGLVIWRVVRDDTNPAWGAESNTPVASLNAVGETFTLAYRDGTPAKIRVTAQSTAQQTMTALIEKLP